MTADEHLAKIIEAHDSYLEAMDLPSPPGTAEMIRASVRAVDEVINAAREQGRTPPVQPRYEGLDWRASAQAVIAGDLGAWDDDYLIGLLKAALADGGGMGVGGSELKAEAHSPVQPAVAGCEHGVRWPWACDACDQKVYAEMAGESLAAPQPVQARGGEREAVFRILADYGQHVRDQDALEVDPVADTFVDRLLAALPVQGPS